MAERYQAGQYNNAFEAEEAVLKFWQENKVFEKSLAKNDPANSFSFYDGPPFITGMPHYGTLLPSIAKDIIPRYQTMKGKYVRRVWGWDVHGLPAENQVEKQLNLRNKKDIEAYGIDKFIDACRQYVNTGSEQWRWYVDHIGRWADLDNAYRTDDLGFMESVMWAFKELHSKGLIYQGRRVSLYCPRCATPLSKFEITMDEGNYKDVEDPAVTVAFKIKDQDKFLLAWTTTPWTLPANLALAVDKDAEYAEVSNGKKTYILAHVALERYGDQDFEIRKTFKGSELVGLAYEPLYTFFETNPEKDSHVYAADFVTMADGTGIVHIAPGFGEDDTKLGEDNGLSLLLTLNDTGQFVEALGVWAGLYYKKADPLIIDDLKERHLLLKNDKITHSYPHCYRCGTPLIYKSQVAWYLKISELRSKLLSQNNAIHWVPEHFGSGRFAYNIENAPDWSISRTRYWGSPIPVWQTDDGEQIVVGSIAELEKLTGQKVKDLHRPHIDNIVITLPDGRKAKRVKEVLDCWFESGSMPFAQFNYPFKNEAEFKQSSPADFIIEYTGQLRGWFYYLHVLGEALFNNIAFRNVVVHGVLMGSDGRKMSKSYGNYPDPRATIEKYGAEALRLYFMGHKVMQGEDLIISEEEIREQSRLLQTLQNSFKYFTTYANLHNYKHQKETPELTLLDRWILLRLEELTIEHGHALDNFDFVTSTRVIRPFIEDLSTWYIRRSRDRFVAGDQAALWTLYDVLRGLALAVAPTLPFSSERIYRSLTQATKNDSVHLQDYPDYEHDILAENRDILEKMADIRSVVSVAHKLRAEKGVSLRQPLESLSLQGFASLESEDEFLEILRQELNVSTIHFDELGGEVACFEENGKKICLNLAMSEALKEEGQYRELLRAIQDARKKAGLAVGEKVMMRYQAKDEIAQLFEKRREDIIKNAQLTDLKAADNVEDGQSLAGIVATVAFKKD